MHTITKHKFCENTPTLLLKDKYGSDWPVVYIIDNGTEAYVGETLDASVRSAQHWQNPERRKLTKISLVSSDDYNKSVILDLEAYLIKHMSADGKFLLQNGNMGLHLHKYYNREEYRSHFTEIWDSLLAEKLADNSIEKIENSEIFKFSPYNSLSADQYATISDIIKELANCVNSGEGMTAIVNGGPGTGKTVLAIHMMKLLMEKNNIDLVRDAEDDESIATLAANISRLPKDIKIGLVVPMQSLRTTLKGVFDNIPGLNSGMVVNPNELANGPDYDILIVDESHRLKRRKALAQYPTFDQSNRILGLGNEGTELDWILKKSRYQILFYDRFQSVKPADIEPRRFIELANEPHTKSFKLTTQFRCRGGEEYIEYARNILSDDNPAAMEKFEEYDLQLFTDCGVMTAEIKKMDRQYQLCRTVAGYAWEWISKKDKSKYDIVLDGQKYRWNSVATDWVNSTGSLDEIGCIHTIQGYDLNYCAVIFGYEIDYDFETESFVINSAKYKDNLARAVGGDMDALKDYILNIYKTLMTRGIRGTYVYACNPNMRKYLERYVPRHQE